MNIKETIAKMTLDEKASLLSGKDFWQTKDLPQHGIPSIFLADGPHGLRKQAAAADHMGLNESIKSTCFPTSATMANSWDPELAEETGRCLGAEAVVQKVNVVLGPGLNIKRNPLCGRNFEYYSEDPYLAGKMAGAAVRGIQSHGVSACLKHFAANSQEERRMVIDSVMDERTLREIYLTAFEIAAKEGGTKTIMTAYNPLNGTYTNENEHLLVDILRKEWGYNGVLVTDWGGNNDRVDALKAGNELEMPTNGGETNREVAAAVREGKLSEKVLDENLERLLTLIDSTSSAIKNKKDINKDYVDAHHDAARRAAEGSIVLLKNEGKLLPLAAGTKVAVIGDFAREPRYQGAGSSIVNPTKLEIPLNSIKEEGFRISGYARGFMRYGKKSTGMLKQALKVADKADTILLYIGLDEMSETEGMERPNMRLPDNQLRLISELTAYVKGKNKKLIAMLSCGSAIEMDWADGMDAVLHCCLGGQAGSIAAAKALSGKVNPSGKLSESYPHKYSDVPNSRDFPAKLMTAEYRESIYIGYRYYEKAGVQVRYPFGFGLSYTTFEYSALNVTEAGVSFKLKNTGAVAGAEVAQLYIGLENSKIFRPLKELKGFKKVHLEPGEEKEVTIPFDDYTFRYFNVKTNKWEIEEGNYTVSVGASVRDVKLKGSVSVKGTTTVAPYEKEKLPSYYSGKVTKVGDAEFREILGRAIPDPHYKFVKKNRIQCGYNTAISEMKYAKGWTGRFLAGGLKFVYNALKFFGNLKLANVIMLGMYHMPLRGLARMTGGAVTTGQLDGLIIMFNGKFFKGLGKFFKEGKIAKKRAKAEQAAKNK